MTCTDTAQASEYTLVHLDSDKTMVTISITTRSGVTWKGYCDAFVVLEDGKLVLVPFGKEYLIFDNMDEIDEE